MSKNRLRRMAMLLAVVLLFSGWQMPVKVSASTGVTVTTQSEFMAALAQKQSPILVSGSITLGDEADSTGKMLPVVIPADTVIQGTAGASLDCRGPIQLSGDGVVIKDIEMTFSSSDALESVPHREIFLAGHSLTLDNVETYLEGAAGSLGGFGGTEEELLPSVYAGGFEGTEVGRAASLTILNATSKTMFQGIYLSHDAGTDSKVPYTDAAILKLCPKVTIRDGIVAETSSDTSIEVSGQGYLNGLKVYGNENTTLAATETNLYSTTLHQVGNLKLSEDAYLELQQGTLVNVKMDKGACLDLNKVPGMVVQGDFVGGEYDEDAQTDERGVLVLDWEGALLIQGAVSGTTVLQTENRNFPGVFISDKRYVTAFDVPYDMKGFVLPDSLIESYEMYYETDGWYVYTLYQDELPTVGSIDIVYAPTAVDVSQIKSNAEPAETAPYCEVIWRDEEGNAFSSSTVEYLGLYFYDTVIGVKTEYWQDANASEQTDWGNVVQFRAKEDASGQYFFYVYEDDIVKTGEYTFLFLDSYCEESLETMADVRALQDRVKAEMTVMLYDSTENVGEATDISEEDILVETIEEQVYTGMMVQPEIALAKDGESLKAGVDYCVTYEDNIAVGTAKAIIVGMGDYCGTREVTFGIIKAEPQLILTMGNDSALEYEQEITLELQILPYNEDAVASVAFYCGDELLGSANVSDSGKAKLTYQTTERKIPMGESSVRAEFDGTANLESGTAELELALQKKTIAEIVSITLQNFASDGSVKTTAILSVTDAEGVTYPATGTAELASGAAGSYMEAKVLNWALTGVRADWYQLPEALASVAVFPAVTITAAQKPEPDPEPIENPFGDVNDTDWFYPYVVFAYKYNLMGGKGEMPDGTLKFDPGNTITRGEFVQMLYSKENKPAVEYADTFTDVPDDKWFTDAILWAAQEEIVGGKKAGFFDVNGKITRQEIALILYKYALYKEYDVSETENADLTGFADAASVSIWADTAMKWAVEYVVIGGKNVAGEQLLAPGGNAIRAEAATMLKAFMTAYEGIE